MHIPERINQPLLPHDDEGDALVRESKSVRVFSREEMSISCSVSDMTPTGMCDSVLDYSAVHGGQSRTENYGYNI